MLHVAGSLNQFIFSRVCADAEKPDSNTITVINTFCSISVILLSLLLYMDSRQPRNRMECLSQPRSGTNNTAVAYCHSGRTHTLAPIHTSLPTVIGRAYSRPFVPFTDFCRVAGSIEPAIGAINTLSPNLTALLHRVSPDYDWRRNYYLYGCCIHNHKGKAAL